MSKHGDATFTCFCGATARRPVVIRGLRMCSACAFDANPSERIGDDMRQWNGQGWTVKPQTQIRRIG